MDVSFGSFIWSLEKELENFAKHGVDFMSAAEVFKDPRIIMLTDSKHSQSEERFFGIGRIESGIITIRYVYREDKIRILGAGFWRRGRRRYEQKERFEYAGGPAD